ncbi:hypothetical protein ACFFWC_31300 [Plantactinospora siamensis]|uniref:Copper chaperone PCu(A)C n=1 Tax=Plantactinospora siamensis TaxID=555372 RepID=A0ABV6P8C2_9ACTN
MTRSISRARRAALLLAGGAAAGTTLLLAGCGAGQIAETSRIEPAISGVNAEMNDATFKVRDLGVDYAGTAGYRAGGDATLHVVLYNDGPDPMTVKVSSSSAGSVALATGPVSSPVPGAEQVTSGPGGASVSPGPSKSTGAPSSPYPGGLPGTGAPSPSTSTSAAGTPSAEGSAAASAGASASAAPAGPASVDIPAHGFVVLDRNSGSYLRLVGLKNALAPGQTVQVTFDVNGQQLTTAAPVAVPLTPAPTAPPVPGAEGGHGG